MSATAGPVVIVGRPHSGSRLLARAFLENGVFMGADLTGDFLDSWSWFQRFVVPLMTSPHFAGRDEEALLRLGRRRLADTLPRYLGGKRPEGAWGWKFCETLFVMPLLKRLLPGARFVHLVRDGRDVCLADNGFFQLTGMTAEPAGWDVPRVAGRRPTYRDFCLAVTFGGGGVRTWRGIDLEDRRHLVAHRYLLQMQSWVTCVTRARQLGALLGDDYVQVRYEDVCQAPVEEVRRLFGRLGLPVRPGVEAFLRREVRTGRMRKWESARLTLQERRDFEAAVALGGPLLEELGYAP